MRHLDEDQLILLYYGEGDDLEAARHHLDECARCRDDFEALERTFAEAVPEPIPERPTDYGQSVWRRIESELRSPSSRWSWLARFRPRQLAWAAAAATLLAAVFFAGRLSTRFDRSPASPSLANVQKGILLVSLGDHLESSQILLMGLVNQPETSDTTPRTIDIAFERQLAEELVGQNRLYRQTANWAGEGAVASVLDELERMLIDIAHSPDELDWREFERLRRRIEAQGVLFKVRVLNTNVKQRQLERVKQKKL